VKLIRFVLSLVLFLAIANARPVVAQATAIDQGVDSVEVMKMTATVDKIDLSNRKVTLVYNDGKKKTVKVDKSVQNLDQVKVGDRLNISYTEELIILVGKSTETPGAAAAGEVGVAPKGAKPGIVMADTTALRAKIVSVTQPSTGSRCSILTAIRKP
jgi:hypothetical protein